MEPTKDVKTVILKQKLTMYRNTLYDVGIDAKIGKMLEDDAQEKAATERMKPLLKSIEFLEEELKSI